MIRLTQEQFETLKRRENPEVFTESQISKWIVDYTDLITKSITDELDEKEKALVNEFDNEFKSFTRIQVISSPKEDELQKGLKYDDFYIREQQIIWDEPIVKSVDGKEELVQAKTGTFADTDHNRKLNRVGERFGDPVEKSEEDELEKAEGDKGGHVIGHTRSGKPVYESRWNGNRDNHHDFTSEDHRDASKIHDKLADEHFKPFHEGAKKMREAIKNNDLKAHGAAKKERKVWKDKANYHQDESFKHKQLAEEKEK